jgi:hypothetical protein
MSRTLLNIAAFQLSWFGCVLGAVKGYPLLGPAIVSIVVVLHLSLAHRPGRELVLILLAGALGALFDSALVSSGWIVYPNGTIWAGTAPYWIVALWLAFATTLNLSMRWLRGSPWVAALFGAIGGPLSYAAGARLGGLQFVNEAAALGALAIGWAVITPLLVELSRRLDGVQPEPTALHRHA